MLESNEFPTPAGGVIITPLQNYILTWKIVELSEYGYKYLNWGYMKL